MAPPGRAAAERPARPARRLIDQLSTHVDVSVVKRTTAVNVFIGNGQSLVVGNDPASWPDHRSVRSDSQAPAPCSRASAPSISPARSRAARWAACSDFRIGCSIRRVTRIGKISVALAGSDERSAQRRHGSQRRLGQDFFSVGGVDVRRSRTTPVRRALPSRAPTWAR